MSNYMERNTEITKPKVRRIHHVFCACRECITKDRGPWQAVQEVINRLNSMGEATDGTN